MLGVQGRADSKLTFICGAGISYPAPSRLPTVSAFVEKASRHCTDDLAVHEALRNAMHDGTGPSARFEVLVNAISQLGVAPASVGALFDASTANLLHRFAASLCQQGAAIITTNFDNCIERALTKEIQRVVFRGVDLDRLGPEDSVIVKPHGSNPLDQSEVGNDLVITIKELARTAQGFRQFPVWRQYLQSLIFGRTIVVIGYSGSDDFDITPILLESEPGYLVWIDYADGAAPRATGIADASPTVQRICSSLPSAYLRGDIGRLAWRLDEGQSTAGELPSSVSKELVGWLRHAFPTEAARQALLGVLLRHYGLHDLTVLQTEMPLSTEALVQRGTALYYLGRYEEACETLRRAASGAPTPAQQCQTLFLLSSALFYSGDRGDAAVEAHRYADLAEQLGDIGELQSALNHSAAISYSMGEREEARRQYQRVLAYQAEYPSLQAAAMATWGLADIANASGLADEAVQGYTEARELSRQLGSTQGVAWMSANLGELLLRAREFSQSATYLQESIVLFEHLRIVAGLLYALACRAQLEYCMGESGAASDTVRSCLPMLSGNPGSAAISTVVMLSYVLARQTGDSELLEAIKDATSGAIRQSAELQGKGDDDERWGLCRRILEAGRDDDGLYAACRDFLTGW